MTRHRDFKRQQRERLKRRQQARRTASYDAVPHLIEAELAEQRGDYATAVRAAETALHIHPRSVEALVIAYRGLIRTHRRKEALVYLERLSEVQSSDPFHPFELGELLLAEERPEEALEAAEECLRRIASSPVAPVLTHKDVEPLMRAAKREIRENQRFPSPPRLVRLVSKPAGGTARPRRATQPQPAAPAAAPAPPRGLLAEFPDLPEDYHLPLAVRTDPEGFERLAARLNDPGHEDYPLRLGFAHLALQRGFDELLCLPTLTGVDFYYHQVETARRVLKHFRGRVLLADEVGLGKTIEAGLILKEYRLRGLVRRALILVPASLVDQWVEEMESKFGMEFETTAHPLYSRDPEAFWRENPLVVSSIHQAKSPQNAPLIAALDYDMVVVDEAHCLRNRNSRNWKLVNQLRKKFLLLLSATPVQNDLLELFNLITVLKPGLLKTEAQFRREFVQSRDPRRPRNAEALRSLLREVMIRNTRSLLALGLPRRSAATVIAQPSAGERELYERLSAFVRRQYRQGDTALRFALQTLLMQAGSSPAALAAGLEHFWDRHGAAHAEAAALLEAARGLGPSAKGEKFLELAAAQPAKIVVFSRYVRTLGYLEGLCRRQGISHVLFHGALSRAEKEQALDRFRGEARLLLATEMGGEGHNLQFCHTLVNFDLPWNPMKIEQRIGRLQRIGQTRDVFVFNFCQAATLEEYLLRVLDSKLNMFQMVIGEVESILGEWEEENEFAQLIVDLWVESETPADRDRQFDDLGDRLLEAKNRYLESRELDARLLEDV